jgi:hypothetical protein
VQAVFSEQEEEGWTGLVRLKVLFLEGDRAQLRVGAQKNSGTKANILKPLGKGHERLA